jgi:hypothetical protein
MESLLGGVVLITGSTNPEEQRPGPEVMFSNRTISGKCWMLLQGPH